MRDGIARALVWVLRLVLPARGKHAADVPELHITPTPPDSPWLKPWAGPSAAQVRAIFGAEEARHLTPVQRERRFAVEFAALGIDYPYRYPGDQFTTREASR